MATRVGFEPATFRTQGTKPTTEPQRPIIMLILISVCQIYPSSFKDTKNVLWGSVCFNTLEQFSCGNAFDVIVQNFCVLCCTGQLHGWRVQIAGWRHAVTGLNLPRWQGLLPVAAAVPGRQLLPVLGTSSEVHAVPSAHYMAWYAASDEWSTNLYTTHKHSSSSRILKPGWICYRMQAMVTDDDAEIKWSQLDEMMNESTAVLSTTAVVNNAVTQQHVSLPGPITGQIRQRHVIPFNTGDCCRLLVNATIVR